MWCLTEGPLGSVDERGPHAVGLCTNAIERMIGNKQYAGAVVTDDLFGFRIGLPVRLEITGLLHRNDMIERKADVRPGCLEHIAVAVRQNSQLVSLGPKLLERGYDICKR